MSTRRSFNRRPFAHWHQDEGPYGGQGTRSGISPSDAYRNSVEWVIKAGLPQDFTRENPRRSVNEFVHSEDARQAVQALDHALARSISESYQEATQHYSRWENEVLRRRLLHAELERSRLEQDNEDLRRALVATRQFESKNLRAEFDELAEQWRDETGHMSSAISFTQHPAYLRIIAMGPAVVPFILQDLERTRSHWFVALRLLTGENPVKLEDKGKVQRIADAWIAWGRERGLV